MGQLLLREAYDQTYGLFDHLSQADFARHSTDLNAKRPLALFAYLPAEHDSGTLLRYGQLASQFLDLELHLFGITVEDFFDMPRERAKILVKAAESRKKINSEEWKRLQAGLGKPS